VLESLARGPSLRSVHVRFEGRFLFSFVARAGTMISGRACCWLANLSLPYLDQGPVFVSKNYVAWLVCG
jgi:hypothetical protein